MSFKQVAQSLDPFIDPGGDLFITVQIGGKRKAEAVPMDSRQGKAILRARLCDVLKKGYPTEHETRAAVEVIYGYALELKERTANASVEYLIAQQPLAQAIRILAKKGGTTKTPTKLLAAVNTIAIREAIDTKKGPWPMSPDSLGVQLKKLTELLKKAGVLVSKSRGDDRLWTIQPIEAKSDGGDGNVTGGNEGQTGENGSPDAFSTLHGTEHGRAVKRVTDDELNKITLNGVHS
jgi:hypothetical protein